MSPVFPNSIEVFDLAENQDTLSPVELDPEKLAHKFKEVCANLNFPDAFFLFWFFVEVFLQKGGIKDFPFLPQAPDQTRGDPGGDPAAEEEGEAQARFLLLPPNTDLLRCFAGQEQTRTVFSLLA